MDNANQASGFPGPPPAAHVASGSGSVVPSRLERRIALRYLRGRKASRFTSLNTRIATTGVAIGVAALIVILGVMTGLRNDLRDKILVANPHLHILTIGATLRVDDWRAALDTIRSDPDVIAAAPAVLVKSMAFNSARYPAAVDVVGLEPDTSESAAIPIMKYVQGDLSLKPTIDTVDGAVALGTRLAERLSVLPGDVITMISSAGFDKISPALGRPNPAQWLFEVTGTFETKMYLYDDGFAIMGLDVAKRFAGLGDAVSGLQVRVRDPWRAEEVGERIVRRLGAPFRSESWQQQNASLFAALELEKLGMGLIITFITVVAAFSIIGTLTMIVGEKTREIGILLAMGLTQRSIGRVFLTQGAIIGLTGTAIGLVLGMSLAYLLNSSELIQIDPSIYFIDHLPVHVQPQDVVIVVLVSLGIALLATLPASTWASRLQPVEAIRHE